MVCFFKTKKVLSRVFFLCQLTFLQLLRTYWQRKEVSNKAVCTSWNEYGLIMCLKLRYSSREIFSRADCPSNGLKWKIYSFTEETSQMTHMSIGIKWVLSHNHLVFILILVVVDPSPVTSTCTEGKASLHVLNFRRSRRSFRKTCADAVV